jgi:hypothetical protein
MAAYGSDGVASQLGVNAIKGILHGQRLIASAEGTVSSVNLDASNRKVLTALASHPHTYPSIFATGDWVLWADFEYSETIPAARLVVGRSHVSLAVPTERIAALPTKPGNQPLLALSPWGNELIYYFPEEQRLFRRTLPSFPCTADVACPDGMACQPDQTCRRSQ